MKAAWKWIKENLKDQDGRQLFSENDVYFEETKEKKVARLEIANARTILMICLKYWR